MVGNEHLYGRIMTAKYTYDSLIRAIRIARDEGIEESVTKPLRLQKQECKAELDELLQELRKTMGLRSNIVRLKDNWHAIRYTDSKGNININLDLVHAEEISLIERDSMNGRELSRTDMERLLPSILDEEAFWVFKSQIVSEAKRRLRELLGNDVITLEEPQQEPLQEPQQERTYQLEPSVHSGGRWVQRVMGMHMNSDAEADRHYLANREAISNQILCGFSQARIVWEHEGIKYYFDDTDHVNMMFLVGDEHGYPRIITQYEENFGFTKEMNTWIVHEQLKVLREAKDEWDEAKNHMDALRESTKDEVNALTDQITSLQSQIDYLMAEKTRLLSNETSASRRLKAVKDRFTAEANKLFKKKE